MATSRGISWHFKRLRKKFRDAQSTGGAGRALRYVAKVTLARSSLLPAYLMTPIQRRRVLAEVEKQQSAASTEIPLIALRATGGIGDLIVIARYVRDLLASVEPFQFDLYSNNPAANWIFQNVTGLRSIYSDFLFDHLKNKYPLALWINHFLVVEGTPQWEALREHKKLIKVLKAVSDARRDIEPAISAYPYLESFLAQKAVFTNRRRADYLHGISNIPYGGDEIDLAASEDCLSRHGLKPKQYITIHNGFDPAFVVTARAATKCYDQFDAVIRNLRTRHPNLPIVQLGVSSSTPIVGVDLDLINNTSIQEAAGVIKHARLHVDGEGGLVHLGRAFGVRSCVLFGPTPAGYFGYPDNINLAPSECGGCWWINETWMDQCPRGFEVPKCMESHAPVAVANAIAAALSEDAPADPALVNFAQKKENLKLVETHGVSKVTHVPSRRTQARGLLPDWTAKILNLLIAIH